MKKIKDVVKLIYFILFINNVYINIYILIMLVLFNIII